MTSPSPDAALANTTPVGQPHGAGRGQSRIYGAAPRRFGASLSPRPAPYAPPRLTAAPAPRVTRAKPPQAQRAAATTRELRDGGEGSGAGSCPAPRRSLPRPFVFPPRVGGGAHLLVGQEVDEERSRRFEEERGEDVGQQHRLGGEGATHRVGRGWAGPAAPPCPALPHPAPLPRWRGGCSRSGSRWGGRATAAPVGGEGRGEGDPSPPPSNLLPS